MSVRVGCPFCNHRVTLPAVPPAGRAVCDRCGETFPVTGTVEAVADPSPVAPPAAPTGLPGRHVALLLLVGLLTAGGLFAVSWSLFDTRPKPLPLPPPAGPVTWPPSAVPLLKHLPPDTGLAFAVQPGPLLAHAKRTDTDPQKLLADLGVPERVFATLTDMGLSLDRIDQLAGGLVFPPDNAIPRVVVAVRPKAPLTPTAVMDTMKATRHGIVDSRTWHDATVGGLVRVHMTDLDGVLVGSNDFDTLYYVVGFSARRSGSDHLPAGLRDSLGQLSPAAFAWAATDSADWATKPTVQLAVKALQRPELLERLKLGRAAAVGLSLEPELRVGLAVKAVGDVNGLQERIAAAVAGKDVLVGGGDGWVTLAAKPEDFPRP